MSIKYWLPLMAILLLIQKPVLAAHSGSAPTDPQAADDENFVTDTDPGLDTGCTYREGGPLIFKVKIDRYVGTTNGDGTLKEPQKLITNKVVSTAAHLTMPAYDIDFSDGEIDEVYFNGHKLDTPLQGSNGTWQENEFTIPIEWVKFPTARGINGEKPIAAENEIRVDIDTRDAGWCTSIDWAELHFKAISPLLLIHGTGANPQAAWEMLPGVTDYLTSLGVPFGHRIQLTPNGTIDANGRQLESIVQTEAKKFGVKQVHLVAHSKGGLDSRSYLSNNYNSKEVRVLSLHTLSTPHQGSILSDISVEQRDLDNGPSRSNDNDIDAFIVLDHYLVSFRIFIGITANRPALDNLRIADMARFNRNNPFPPDISLYTYGANADLNSDREITANETRPLIPGSVPNPIAANMGNISHSVLGRVATVRVTRVNELFGLSKYRTHLGSLRPS